MDETRDVLQSLPIFAGLAADEIDLLAGMAGERTFAEGEIVFREGDPADEMFFVVTGAVELEKTIAPGVDRTVMTARVGAPIGMLSLFDGGERPGTARAAEATRTLVFDRTSIERFEETAPRAGITMLRRVAAGLGLRVRQLVEQYRSAVEWSLSVGGAAALNLHRLVESRARLTVDLTNGGSVSGTLLKVEPSEAGHEIWLRTAAGSVAVVPYHAVAMLSLEEGDLPATDDGEG